MQRNMIGENQFRGTKNSVNVAGVSARFPSSWQIIDQALQLILRCSLSKLTAGGLLRNRGVVGRAMPFQTLSLALVRIEDLKSPMPGKPAPNLPCHIPDHTLIRIIGRGAYGEVWLAKNVMGTWRAVKIVRRESFTSERPYEREFEGIRKFEPVSRAHDTQVDILHVGRDDEAGLFYYVMELGDDVLSGQQIDPATYVPRTLASELQAKNRLPARLCLETALALATALDHLHAHGLIHRDIKPSNIIFIHGRAKLADIGLVAEAAVDVSFVGTEGYVPVEGPGSSRADIFSLGRVLYEISTGFSQRQFPDIPSSFGLDENDGDLARELNLIINRACAHRADDRYQSAAALREELLLLQSGHSIRRVRENERRMRALKWFGAAAAVVAVFAGVGYFSARQANARADANAARAEEKERNATEQARRAGERLIDARLAQARWLRDSSEPRRRGMAERWAVEAAESRPSLAARNELLAATVLAAVSTPSDSHISPYGDNRFGTNPLRERISRDGRFVAFAPPSRSDDDYRRTMAIHDAKTGAKLGEVGVNRAGIRGTEFSPDGELLAVTSNDSTRIWRWRENRIVFEAATPANARAWDCTAGFSGDGRRFSVAVNGGVEIRAADGTAVQKFDVPDSVGITAIHPSLPRIAIATKVGGTVRDFERSEELFRWDGDTPVAMAWSPDALTFATLDRAGLLVVFDTEAGTRLTRQAHSTAPVALAFSADGRFIVTSASVNDNKFWRAHAGSLPIATNITGFALGFSPDGQKAISTKHSRGFDHASFFVPEDRYAVIVSPPGAHAFAKVSLSRDSRWLASLDEEGSALRIWKFGDGKAAHRAISTAISAPRLISLDFAPDGRSLICGGIGGAMRWAVSDEGTLAAQPEWIWKSDLNVKFATLSPDGKTLVVSVSGVESKTQKVVVLSLNATSAPRELITEENYSHASWQPDGKRVALTNETSYGDCILDTLDLKVVRNLGYRAMTSAFSPDGAQLVLAGSQNIEVWNSQPFERVRAFDRLYRDGAAARTAFPRDGKTLAVLDFPNAANLYDAASGEALATLTIPDGETATGLLFRPDGSLVLHGREMVHVFKIAKLREILRTVKLDWQESRTAIPDVVRAAPAPAPLATTTAPTAGAAVALFSAPTIVPGTERRIVEFTDQDGDGVRVAISHGHWDGDEGGAPSKEQFITRPGGAGHFLQRVELSGSAASDVPQDVSITVVGSSGGRGNGSVEVGAIQTISDLRRVVVEGDLSRLLCGDPQDGALGIEHFEARTLGFIWTHVPEWLDGAGLHQHYVEIRGDVTGAFIVRGSVYGTRIGFDAVNGSGGNVKLFQIGDPKVSGSGSLIGGNDDHSARVLSAGNVERAIIAGDIIGGTGYLSGILDFRAAAKIEVLGSVIGTDQASSRSGSGAVSVGKGEAGEILIHGDVRGGAMKGSGLVQTNGKTRSIVVRGALIGGDQPGATGQVILSSDADTVEVGRIEGRAGAGGSGIFMTDGNLKRLVVHGSVVGGTGEKTAIIWSKLTIGSIRIEGDIVAGAAKNSCGISARKIGSIEILGSVSGSPYYDGESISCGSVESVRIAGNVRGHPDYPWTLLASAPLEDAPSGKHIGSVSIGGDVDNIQIVGGGRKSPDGQIGRVEIGGNCLGSSIVASTQSTGESTTRRFGTSADKFVGKADTAKPSRIDEIIIHGRVATGSGKMKPAQILDGSGNAFMAQEIGTLQINGKIIPTKGSVKTPLDPRGKTRVETQR